MRLAKLKTIYATLIAVLAVFLFHEYLNLTGMYFSGKFSAKVTRVIDGDTFVISNGERIRLLGINAPEMFLDGVGKEYYAEKAKNELKKLVEGKNVKLRAIGKDRYGRTLAYVWVGKTFVNKYLLEKGCANAFLLKENKKEFIKAEDEARKRGIGIWKKSEFYGCIKLVSFRYKHPEKLSIKNICNFTLNLTKWYIKDEDHHFLIFNISLKPAKEITIYSGNSSAQYSFRIKNVWNDEGDEIFIRDSKGLLAFYYRY